MLSSAGFTEKFHLLSLERPNIISYFQGLSIVFLNFLHDLRGKKGEHQPEADLGAAEIHVEDLLRAFKARHEGISRDIERFRRLEGVHIMKTVK